MPALRVFVPLSPNSCDVWRSHTYRSPDKNSLTADRQAYRCVYAKVTCTARNKVRGFLKVIPRYDVWNDLSYTVVVVVCVGVGWGA